MKTFISRAALAAVAVSAVAGSAVACGSDRGESEGPAETTEAVTNQVPQEMGGPPPLSPEERDRQMVLITELSDIDQRLQPVQTQAFADPDITAQQAALAETVEAAMEEAVPGTIAKRQEFDQLLTAFESAQQAGDQAKIAELTPRLQTLDMELGTVQQQVEGQAEIRSAIESFQATLIERMTEIDPEARALLDRREQIAIELQGGPGGPAGDEGAR